MPRTFPCRSAVALAALSLSVVWSGQVLAQSRPAEMSDVTAGDAQAEVVTFSAPGATPERVMRAIVVLPRDYARDAAAAGHPSAKNRYPVVYLLHGYGADCTSWYVRSREAGRPLSMYADRYGLIIVCVDGRRASWYLDAPPDSEEAADWQIETMFTRHLVPEIDRRYRTWADALGRAVVGLSMGGHGAIYLAARHPELLSVCGDMSGVVDLTHVINKQDLTRRLGPIEKHRDRWLEHSAITQAERFAGRRVGVLIDCGWGDSFFEDHRLLHEKLTRLQVPHDFIQRPGGHDWPYWINALPYHLQFASDRLRPAGITGPPTSLPGFRPVVLDQGGADDSRDLGTADMNGDGKPDVVVARSGGVAWYENPGWGRHPVTAPFHRNIVSVAAEDIDRDGRIDLAWASERTSDAASADGGIWWARNGPAEPWTAFPVTAAPGVCRIRWADVDGDGRRELLVGSAGAGAGADASDERSASLRVMHVPGSPETDRWTEDMIREGPQACSAIVPLRFVAAPFEQILTAGAEGIHVLSRQPATGAWTSRQLGAGDQAGTSSRGTGDVAFGRLRGGQRFLAAIEPPDAGRVVAYMEPPYANQLWTRVAVDDAPVSARGVACGDLNGDGDDEIVVACRAGDGQPRAGGVRAYMVAADSLTRWEGRWIDEEGMAAEAVRIVDLNGDGRPDIVAAGRRAASLKVYLNGK